MAQPEQVFCIWLVGVPLNGTQGIQVLQNVVKMGRSSQNNCNSTTCCMELWDFWNDNLPVV